MELKATPVNTNLIDVILPPMFAIAMTANDTVIAPTNAPKPTEVARKTPTPSKIDSVAPRDAPDEIPRIYGSANGFFTIACITTPTTASPIPTPTPSMIRGRRITHTISCTAPLASSSGSPKRNSSYKMISYTCFTDKSADPTVTAYRIDKISKINNIKIVTI